MSISSDAVSYQNLFLEEAIVKWQLKRKSKVWPEQWPYSLNAKWLVTLQDIFFKVFKTKSEQQWIKCYINFLKQHLWLIWRVLSTCRVKPANKPKIQYSKLIQSTKVQLDNGCNIFWLLRSQRLVVFLFSSVKMYLVQSANWFQECEERFISSLMSLIIPFFTLVMWVFHIHVAS